jgi:hypothetical protein
MRCLLRILGVAFVLVLCVGAARAGSLIEFANVTDRARPARLLGYLARPDGDDHFQRSSCCTAAPGFSRGMRRRPIS